jgi:hypothetical protein
MLTSDVVLHDNARPHTDACTRELLENFIWALFDQLSYSPDLAPSDYHLFTYLKNCSGLQHFSSKKLIKGGKTWLISQTADLLTRECNNFSPDMTSNSILAVTTLRSSLSIYVLFRYNKLCFLSDRFVNNSPEITFRTDLVVTDVFLRLKTKAAILVEKCIKTHSRYFVGYIN